MLFNSFSFVFFFAVVWGVTKCLNGPRRIAWRNVLLLVASLFFYAWFRFDFLFWLVAIIIVNFCGGLWLARSAKNGKAKVAISIVFSLLPLIVFKYSGFLSGSLASLGLLPELFPQRMSTLILPVGLSFFTFQALTYSIDLYRKKITVERNIIDFALFVSFFPTILSGPITRSRDLLPQFKQPLPMTMDAFSGGFQQFVWGLFKKCVVADRLAQYVDSVYAMPDAYSGKSIALAAVCYSIQIYCDFSGYSDMAIGCAKVIGFSLKKNFDFPYFAAGIRDFWKRWHIALTGWFTEYLYISCGGNRVNRARWVLNIMLVFLASGLWHGASWTFLIWGAMHGILYLAEFVISRGRKEPPASIIGKIVSGIVTFAAVTILWIFFRSPDFQTALLLVQRIFENWSGQLHTMASTFSFVVMLAVTGFTLVSDIVLCRKKIVWDDINATSPARIGFCIALLLGVELLAIPSTQFVYFLF